MILTGHRRNGRDLARISHGRDHGDGREHGHVRKVVIQLTIAVRLRIGVYIWVASATGVVRTGHDGVRHRLGVIARVSPTNVFVHDGRFIQWRACLFYIAIFVVLVLDIRIMSDFSVCIRVRIG